jgi:hypothetical protein
VHHHVKLIVDVLVSGLALVKQVEILGDLGLEIVGVSSVTMTQVFNRIGETVAVILKHARDGKIKAQESTRVFRMNPMLFFLFSVVLKELNIQVLILITVMAVKDFAKLSHQLVRGLILATLLQEVVRQEFIENTLVCSLKVLSRIFSSRSLLDIVVANGVFVVETLGVVGRLEVVMATIPLFVIQSVKKNIVGCEFFVKSQLFNNFLAEHF